MACLLWFECEISQHNIKLLLLENQKPTLLAFEPKGSFPAITAVACLLWFECEISQHNIKLLLLENQKPTLLAFEPHKKSLIPFAKVLFTANDK